MSNFISFLQEFSTQLVQAAHYLGVIAMVICGLSLLFSNQHATAKIVGTLGGLFVMLAAQPIVTWMLSFSQ